MELRFAEDDRLPQTNKRTKVQNFTRETHVLYTDLEGLLFEECVYIDTPEYI